MTSEQYVEAQQQYPVTLTVGESYALHRHWNALKALKIPHLAGDPLTREERVFCSQLNDRTDWPEISLARTWLYKDAKWAGSICPYFFDDDNPARGRTHAQLRARVHQGRIRETVNASGGVVLVRAAFPPTDDVYRGSYRVQCMWPMSRVLGFGVPARFRNWVRKLVLVEPDESVTDLGVPEGV